MLSSVVVRWCCCKRKDWSVGVDEGFKQSVLAACLMVFVVADGCRW
jgi:hypothetical protein